MTVAGSRSVDANTLPIGDLRDICRTIDLGIKAMEDLEERHEESLRLARRLVELCEEIKNRAFPN